MTKSHVICVGPIGLPLTGQAIATETWANGSSFNVEVADNNFEGLSNYQRIKHTLLFLINFMLMVKKRRHVAMYLSIKRSVFGALIDCICVYVYKFLSSGPIIVHVHGSDLLNMRRNFIAKFVVKLIWIHVSDVLVLSPKMVEQLKGLPMRHVHTVNNFSLLMGNVDRVTQKFIEARHGCLKVLYLSNIMYTKGFYYLIQAVSNLRGRGYNISLTLAGKVLSDNAMSAAEAQDLLSKNLSKGINYVGPLYGEDKWRQLENAHIIALPTFYPVEAQPISLIEGMAHGALPLATRHNYNEDFLDEAYTSFVIKEDVDSIAQALQSLYDDRENLISRMKLSIEEAENKFTTAKYIKKIDKILYSAISA